MYPIIQKRVLNETVTLMKISAPMVARKAKPGQFIIFRIDEEGDALLDFVGPLGEPSHTEGIRRAAVIGGGLGVAIAYPQAKALHDAGAEVSLASGTDLAGNQRVKGRGIDIGAYESQYQAFSVSVR